MFNQNGGYSLSDIAAATGDRNNNNGGWGDGGAWWIIILFLFCFAGWGGNGFGNGGYNGTTTTSSVREEIDAASLRNMMGDLNTNLANGFYNLNTSGLTNAATTNEYVNGGIRSIQSDICNLNTTNLQNKFDIATLLNQMSATQAQCCCDNKSLINQSFADLNYNLATIACQNRQTTVDNARDIIQAGQENTRAILDFLVNDKITTLTTENQALRSAQSQAEQNAYLIAQLGQKAPIPAYVVQNPYSAYSANTGCTGCSSTLSY